MNLLAPFGLLFGLLALPILALYMLKLRRRDVQVSSTMLWSALLRDRQANTPWQRLKRNLLLFLQLLILAALALALARPAVPVRTVASGSQVVILDGSASMSASDMAPSRFGAARSQVRELIGGLQPGARMTLILAANPPQVLANADADPQRLLAALDAASPGQGSADWAQTFALAAGAAASAGPEVTTLILSDGGVGGAALPALPGAVRYIPFGESSENTAIRALSVRPAADGLELFASVHNYGSAAKNVLLSLEADGQFVTARELKVPAGSDADLLISGLNPGAGIFKAALSAPAGPDQALDALALDDTAFALNQKPQARSAWVLSQDMVSSGEENIFLFQMLRALDIQVKTPATASPITGTQLTATKVPTDTFRLYVFDGTLPALLPAQALPAQALPTQGSLLIINPPVSIPGLLSATAPLTVTGQIGLDPEFRADPFLAQIQWEPVYVARARTISAPWAQTVVSAGGLPLVLRGELDGRRIVVLSFDLHDSNLPLEVAYPILMIQLLDYLAPLYALEGASEAIAPGTPVNLVPQPGVKAVIVGKPDGSFTRYDTWTPPITFADTGELGVYAVNLLDASGGGRVESFVVNLFDPRESAISPRPALQIGQTNLQAAEAGEVSLREFWRWPAAAALALLLLEWLLYHRRIRPLAPLPTLKTPPSRVGKGDRGVW